MQTSVNHHPAPEEQQKTIKGKIWIVLVGINHYESLSPLKYCANDCQDLAQAFDLATKNFEDREIIALHDFAPDSLQPKREHIHASIAKFALAQPEDTILFYFSGHGEVDPKENRPVLCLADTKLDDLANTGLILDTLLEALETSTALHKLVFLDACRSGSITTNPVNRVIDTVQQQVNQDGNLYAIVSCKKGQCSWEIDSLKHGAFTYCLIKGLRGRAADSKGLITASNLFNFIGEQIQTYLEYAKQGQSLSGEKGLKVKPLTTPNKSVRQRQGQIPDYAVQQPECITRYIKTPTLGFATKIPRQALIINSLYTSETTLYLVNLLQGKGGFEMDYCPSDFAEANTIEASIISCLTSNSAETALLYLAGRVEETERNVYKLWLNNKVSITFNWLRECLDNSAIKDKIVILDLWGTTGVKEFPKASQLGFSQKQCLIVSYAQKSNSNRFLIKLIEILEEEAQSEKELWLIKLITQVQTWSNNEPDIVLSPLVPDFTDTINVLLPHTERSNDASFVLKRSPYKGLQAFTKNDTYFFHGRKELTEKIYNKLRISNFLAVVGASGSGKSSVVQAGVLPLIEQTGLYQSGELKSCQTWVMRPDRKPFESLARVLGLENELITEGQLYLGIDSFVSLLAKQPLKISVLIIDQFEELFTLAGETERKEFLELILGTVERASDKFKVVITLRDDFFKNCLNDPLLKDKIQQSLVSVPPDLNAKQYREIIVEPAKKVGLSVEEGLVNRLIEEVQTGGLPLLEFALEELWMQRDSQAASLTLKEYEEKIGGLRQILEKKAEETYLGLSQEEKECAQWIFLSLVQLGEGQEDTRRRVTRSDLEVEKYAPKLVDSTLNKLIAARLIYVGREEEEAQSDSTEDTADSSNSLQLSSQPDDSQTKIEAQTTVEVAHEILIRNWEQLRWWLKENRQRLRLMREVGRARSLWQQEKCNPDYLQSGAALAQAEELLIKYGDEISAKDRQFIAAGVKFAKSRKRQIASVITGVIATLAISAGAALWQLRRATINEINALNSSTEELLKSNQELDALIAGLKAAKKVKSSWFGIDSGTKNITLASLNNILSRIKETNSLEGHTGGVFSLKFSPDGQTIISSSPDTTVRMWNLQGKLLHTLENQTDQFSKVHFVGQHIASRDSNGKVKLWNLQGKTIKNLDNKQFSEAVPNFNKNSLFSPDGQMVASASNNTVKLWNTKGIVLQTLTGHTDNISQLAFSPDGQTLASASNNTVKLWNIEGILLHTFKVNTNSIDKISFSPNGKTITTENWGDSATRLRERKHIVELWNLKGDLLQSFQGSGFLSVKITFSPDGQMIASSDRNTGKLWNLKGDLLQSFQGKILFSPNGQMIASSNKNIVKLWNLNGDLIKTLNGISGHLEFSPDGNTLITERVTKNTQSKNLIDSLDGQSYVDFWNLEGKKLATFEFAGTLDPYTRKISPDGQIIAFLEGTNEKIRIWNFREQVSQTIEGHENLISDFDFSPDGQTLASASLDGTIKLWNLKGQLLPKFHGNITSGNIGADFNKYINVSADSGIIAFINNNKGIKLWNQQGELLHTLNGHTDDIHLLAFSPDGTKLASSSADNTAKIWNQQGEWLHTLVLSQNNSSTSTVFHVDFIHDDGVITYSYNHQTVKLWNSKGTHIRSILQKQSTDGYYQGIELSPDGKSFAVVSPNNTIEVWDFQGNLLYTLSGYQDRITDFKFSPDGKTIVSTFGFNTFKIWSNNGELLHTFGSNQESIQFFDFSPDGKTILSSYLKPFKPKIFKIWSNNGELLHTFEDGTSKVIFSPDKQMIASANSDGTVKLWNLEGKLLHTFKGHTAKVWSIAFSPDGQIIASASSDRTARLWNVVKREESAILHGHQDMVTEVKFSPDSKRIISNDNSQTKVWNLQGKILQSFPTDSVNSDLLKFHPNGKTFASVGGDTIKLWNIKDNLLQTIEGHTDEVWDLALSPDGQIIASASLDGTIKLWNIKGKLIHTLTDHNGRVWNVEFSPDGKYLASSSDDSTIKLWNIKGKLIHTLTGHRDNSEELISLAFSPDSKALASAGQTQIKIWTLDGKLIKNLQLSKPNKLVTTNPVEIRSMSFSPNGKYIASISKNGKVNVWNSEYSLIGSFLTSQLNFDSNNNARIDFSRDGQMIATSSDDRIIKLWSNKGALLHTLTGHTSDIKHLAFSPDKKVLTSADKHTLVLWDFDLDNVLLKGCSWAKDYLSTNPNISQDDKEVCEEL